MSKTDKNQFRRWKKRNSSRKQRGARERMQIARYRPIWHMGVERGPSRARDRAHPCPITITDVKLCPRSTSCRLWENEAGASFVLITACIGIFYILDCPISFLQVHFFLVSLFFFLLLGGAKTYLSPDSGPKRRIDVCAFQKKKN